MFLTGVGFPTEKGTWMDACMIVSMSIQFCALIAAGLPTIGVLDA